MDKNGKNEFDLDFDFEKEYGISPDFLLETELDDDALLADFLKEDIPEPQAETAPFPQEPAPHPPVAEDLPLEDLLADDFLADIRLEIPETPQYAPEEPQFAPQEPVYVPEEPQFAPQEPVYVPEEASATPEVPPVIPPMPAQETPQPPAETESLEAPISRAEQRRIQRMKRRKFKEVYLPAILAGTSLVLCLIFIIGAVSRGIANGRAEDEAAIQASKDAEDAAEALDREASQILAQAEALAAGYNYQGAIDVLNTFSGELTSYSELVSAKARYSQQLTQVQAWSDPKDIVNLSFHVLIADPARAFTDKGLANSYNRNFVTIGEFEKILEQLYANGYVLVGLDDVITETVGEDGTVTYAANTIYLPVGKTPIMLTETMVNYFAYMVDSDDDGQPDAGGGGFAHRLVVDDNGDIKAEMVNADGETVVGDYDFVPVLEKFIEEHPDFSYQGARAILAVSGKEGIFGYRINTGTEDEKAKAAAGATEVVNALRDQGYSIACYTYENIDYTAINATAIQNDLKAWFDEIKPVLGEVDIMVFARHIDLTDYGTGNGKFNVLYSSGFRYFIGAANAPTAEVTSTYFHQRRLLVTGSNMAYSSTMFTKYFNSMSILDDQRGTVPT